MTFPVWIDLGVESRTGDLLRGFVAGDFETGSIYLLKRCPEHGAEKILVADDIDHYRRCREVFDPAQHRLTLTEVRRRILE